MNRESFKQEFSEELKREVAELVYAIWLADAGVDISADGTRLCLVFPNAFIADTVRNALSRAVENAAHRALGYVPEIAYLALEENTAAEAED